MNKPHNPDRLAEEALLHYPYGYPRENARDHSNALVETPMLDKRLLRTARGLVLAGIGGDRTARNVAEFFTEEGAKLVLFRCRPDSFAEEMNLINPENNNQESHGVPLSKKSELHTLESLFVKLKADWGLIDFLVYVCGAPDRSILSEKYVDTDSRSFHDIMEGCVHGFTALSRHATAVMAPDSSMLTLIWPALDSAAPRHSIFEIIRAAQEASVRCLADELGPLGIRVNAIATGRFSDFVEKPTPDQPFPPQYPYDSAPLRRAITREEIGKAAVYLTSGLASGITGETLHVDAGRHIIGLRGVPPP